MNLNKLIQGKKWKEICNKVFDKYNGVCQDCGKQLRKLSGNTQVHHIIPRRFWTVPEDSNESFNLVLLCQKCHKFEENKILTMEKLRGFQLTKMHLFKNKGF